MHSLQNHYREVYLFILAGRCYENPLTVCFHRETQNFSSHLFTWVGFKMFASLFEIMHIWIKIFFRREA